VHAFFDRQPATEIMLASRELAHDVFYDHHRPVDNQPEINGAKTH